MSDSNWLNRLLAKANSLQRVEGFDLFPDVLLDENLEASYGYCERITAIHSKSFHLASSMLPNDKRKAVRALYAFCRTSDDIIDRHTGADTTSVEAWRNRALAGLPNANDPVSIAWAHARMRFNIPVEYAHQLIDGVATDLHKQRYLNFDELVDYCYGVASTVGLMSMHIVGYESDTAKPHAIRLGVALQLINILRDIAEDYRMGRVYLPQDEMRMFGVGEHHIREGIIDDAWKSFMRFQISRVREFYTESWIGLSKLHPGGRMAISAALVFYKGILEKIEDSGYDVFSKRASVSGWGKLKMIPRIWFDSSVQVNPSLQLTGK
jgi:phytoene synthase